ncbi:PAS domain S-box-containing protein [Mariprofundus aestuarium]|uniref:histidine kinase n=1 Tax=Mariprofundus aestuarium TaxID=1921086 RepID=A0A2K8KZW9_MARES|nr:PAS domain S-box protein [Mariprofundus aestuarium]ATX80547.1 PAS domain S-box-containing protein [Mariprofundus aestuarium]
MFRKYSLCFLAAALCFLPTLSLAANDSVSLHLRWKHQFQFAGFYMALEKGYYRDVGLEVTLIEGGPDKSSVQHVLNSRGGAYGVTGTGAMIERADGKPIKALAVIFQHSPLALLVTKDSGIRTFSDLRGRRVMLQEGQQNSDVIAALKAIGMTEKDIIRQNISYDINDLITGNTDAFSSYVTDQPHQLDLLGVSYHTLSPRTHGIDFYGDILITSDEEVQKHPERTRTFIQASILGWNYALEHMDETIDLILEKYNTQNFPRSQLVFEAKESAKLIMQDVVKIGYMNSHRWDRIAATYIDQGFISPDYQVADFIYQPEITFADLLGKDMWKFAVFCMLLILLIVGLHSLRLRRAVHSRAVELHKEREQLQENEAKLRGLYELSPLGIALTDMKGCYLEFNQAFQDICGYCHEELQTLDYWTLTPKKYAEDEARQLESLQQTGRYGPYEKEYLRKDGSLIPIRLNGLLIKDHEGRDCIWSIVEDITERKLADERLRKLSQAVEQAGESVIITDKHGTIEYVNSSFTRITGYLPKDVLGNNPRVLKSGNQNPEFYKLLWNTISSGNIWHSAIIDRRKDGSQYPALMTISPILNEGEEITHYVGIQQDMTNHEALEEKFRQAQKMEALGTLVGGIAHDFNNMLAGMTGNLYLAKKKVADSPDVIEKLENVEALSFRAAEMIKQLLVFARKGNVKMTPFGLTSFLKQASKLSEASIPESINIHFDYCHEELVIKGDGTQLQQALMNLLNNSRDALEDVQNPTITVTLEEFEADESFINKHPDTCGSLFAHLTVRDNGSGISDTEKEHIFEPFYTSKEVGSGTGLGLPMVYGAIQSHGGILEVESGVGSGTSIHIYLPLLEEHKIEVISEEYTEVVPGSGELILIVDDNADIRKTSKEVLEKLGYQVMEASDGLEAIEQFTTNQDSISLIIMDVVMPNLGGVKASERIKKLRPDVKVIFATGYDKDETLKDEMPVDKHMILSKPYNIVKLSQLIREQFNS